MSKRYGEATNVRAFDGVPGELTEMDALVAYLQILGRLTDAPYKTAAPVSDGRIAMTHDTLVAFSKTFGLFYLIGLSVGRAGLRLLAANRKQFDRAAAAILQDDDRPWR